MQQFYVFLLLLMMLWQNIDNRNPYDIDLKWIPAKEKPIA